MISTTSRLLRRHGYTATGLNQIVAEARAPKGSMYFHFPGGKEELAASALDRYAAALQRAMARCLAEEPTVGAAVARMLDELADNLVASDYSEGCAVAAVALESADTHPTLADAVHRALRGWIAGLADALVAAGHEPSDAQRTATLVIAAIEGAVVLGKGTRSDEPLRTTGAALRATLDGSPPAG